MNIFYRVVAGAAAICIGLGVLLGGMGVLLGGRVNDLPVRGFGFGLTPSVWGSDTVEAGYQGIRKLDFDFEAMDVEIREGDGFSVRADRVNARRFITRQDGDTWEIRCDNKYPRGRMNFGDRWEKSAPRVVVTLPRDFVAQELDLDMGMGTLTATGLSALESDLDLGMGEMTVTDFSSGSCDLKVGMGSLILTGSLTGRGDIECGMGSIEMTLLGRESDYGFDTTVGMGEVTIGTHSTGGLGGAMLLNNTAPNFFGIDCGMGSIEIGFTE